MQDISHKIIKGIYLTMYSLGCSEISILSEDIEKQVLLFENILLEYDINMGEVFNKTSIFGDYEIYVYLLFEIFSNSILGYITNDYKKVIINIPDYWLKKELAKISEYQEPITRCAKEYLGLAKTSNTECPTLILK